MSVHHTISNAELVAFYNKLQEELLEVASEYLWIGFELTIEGIEEVNASLGGNVSISVLCDNGHTYKLEVDNDMNILI